MHNNYQEQEIGLVEQEIDLKNLIKTLIDSKILIITFTLICTILATIFSYQQNVTTYKAEARMFLGEYNGEMLFNSLDLTNKLYYLFNANSSTSVSRSPQTEIKQGLNYITLKSNSKSAESSKSEIENLINYITVNSQKLIEDRIANDKQIINSNNLIIDSTDKELNNLILSQESLSQINPLILIYITNLRLNREKLLQENTNLSQRLLKADLHKPTKVTYMKETSIKPNSYKTILLGFITGFILSLFLVLIKQSFRTSNKKNL